jgi:hypothetical protein
MSTATFDKLLYLETLKAAGVPDDQARAHAHALDEAMRDTVATKSDIGDVKASMREMELRLTVKMGAMLIALGGFLAAIKFFGH